MTLHFPKEGIAYDAVGSRPTIKGYGVPKIFKSFFFIPSVLPFHLFHLYL